VATSDITARPLEWNPPRQAISRVPYLPGLDGMRALAVVAVMLYHTNNGWLPGGFIGVEVFFVISGYLITLLLIGEHEKTGHIDLRQFWIRRARRLLPALFLMMAMLMVYSAIFERDTLGKLRGDVLAGIGYITNWYHIWVGAGYTASADFAPLRHLWSLAVEEQFYLVWPLVMIALIGLGRRRLPDISRWLVLAAIAIAVIVGVMFHPGRISTPEITPNAYWEVGSRSISKMDTLYLSTITRSTGLLVGAAFAMLWRPVAVMRGPLRRRGRELDVIAVVGLAGLGAAAWYLHVIVQDGPRADPWLFRGGFLAVDVATVMVIAAVTHQGAAAGPLLGNPVLNWIGTRSYGLYLYHWPIYQIIRTTAGGTLTGAEFAGAMAATAVITELSYRLVEMPIRRGKVAPWWEQLREGDDPARQQAVAIGAVACTALFGFAAVSMASAELKQNEVAEALGSQGQGLTVDDIINGTSTSLGSSTSALPTSSVAPTSSVVGATAPPAPSTAPIPSTTALVAAPVVAFGDSVMANVVDSLTGLGVQVVADVGLQIYDINDDIEQLAAAGALPETVIIHLGTNGEFQYANLTSVMDLLRDVDRVFVVTIHGPSYTDANNAQIRALPTSYPNVQVIDWDREITENCTGDECLAADNIHPGADGAALYVSLVRGALGI
jgi:peptidoglycan/LPS O-acetylase OafA/YrhL